jgi:CubicO group peptidase (beta-lactamase class C family)
MRSREQSGRRWAAAAGFALVVIGVFAAWQPWYVMNTWRLATRGWVTTVDRALFYPDATDVYRPLAIVAGVEAPTPLPRRLSDDQEFKSAIDYAYAMESYGLLVWHDGAVVLERYWPGAGPDSRPDGASMHKSVTALTVGALIAAGRIGGVDDPIDMYVPEWAGRAEGKITLRQLLGMASGLATFSQAGGLVSEANRFLAGLMPERMALARSLIAPPGREFTYRNLNTQLLGIIIERAAGRPYAEVLSEHLWKPLGAADAYVWLDRTDGLARTYTALLARAEDWLRLGLIIKDRGALLGRPVVPADWIAQMTAPSPANANYGFQIWRAHPYQERRYYNPALKGLSTAASEPILAEDMVFFDGVGGQRVYVSADHGLVIVRLGVARPDWDDSALPNAVLRALNAE